MIELKLVNYLPFFLALADLAEAAAAALVPATSSRP